MLYDAHHRLAEPGLRSTCRACGQELLAKCGSIKIWHWAHRVADCDPWASPESQWHLLWKQRLEAAGADIEVPIDNHRADVVFTDGRILELQGNYLPYDAIQQREAFYGKQLAWLYRCHWKDRIHWGDHGFWWKNGAPSMVHHERPLYWDMGEDVARVNINLVGNDKGNRILGYFIGRESHRQSIRRWTGTDPTQTRLIRETDDAPLEGGYATSGARAVTSLVGALEYHFPGAKLA